MKYCIIVIAATIILLMPNIGNAQIIEGMKPAEMGEVIPYKSPELKYYPPVQNYTTKFSPNGEKYISNHAEEYIYSFNKNELIKTETIWEFSFFDFSRHIISFNKFNKKWLQNNWRFEESKTEQNEYIEFYTDSNNQLIIINYTNKTLQYYWNWSDEFNRFLYLTMYKELKKID